MGLDLVLKPNNNWFFRLDFMLMCLFIYLFVAPVGKMVLIYKNEIWSEILL